MEKKIIFSGVQPSGKITLANYLGAISNWVTLQEEYDNYFCVVDMHAITVPQVPKDLRENTLRLFSQYLACGLDTDKSTLFIQSHVPEHVELAWVLQTMTYMGELGRMTQYKDKVQKGGENLNSALFTYPVLMAADILLYSSNLVPVGDDQRQHVEITRDIAERFNSRYSETFAIPEIYTPKIAARVMSLQEPHKKMSKSAENEKSYISLMDSNDMIIKKIKGAVTDSEGIVRYSNDQLGIKNLIEIYSKITGEDIDSIVNKYEGKGYGIFKSDLADAVVSVVEPIRDEADRIFNDKAYLEAIYAKGAEKAQKRAGKMMSKVYKKIGMIPKVR
ncbi:MAG: tryptophan--tRNA ligase [Filifactoraceae bacterium]